MSPSYQSNDSNASLTSSQSIQQYLMQDSSQHSPPANQQTQQQAQQSPPQVPCVNNSPPDSPIPTTVMGQLMGALNPSIFDDLNLNIETLQAFDCDIEEVRIDFLSLVNLKDETFN